jgi:hypothetical protein
MKISEILHSGQEQDVDVVDWQWLTEHTREYREHARRAGKWLYRGMKNRPVAFHGRSRDDRWTESSDRATSMVFDYILAYHFNATALRLNSVFCTSDVAHAGIFGRQYVIFPLDGFRYTYTTMGDLVLSNLDNIEAWQDRTFLNWVDKVVDQAKRPEDADWLGNNISSRMQDPYALIEQWLPQHAGDLVAMGIDPDLAHISLDRFLDVDKFRYQFQPQTTNLQSALVDGVEVYIRGEYMALDLNSYADKIQEHFRIEVA